MEILAIGHRFNQQSILPEYGVWVETLFDRIRQICISPEPFMHSFC